MPKSQKMSNYHSYIHKLLKSKNNEMGISKKSIIILDKILSGVESKLVKQASDYAILLNKSTLSPKMVQCATRTCLPQVISDGSVRAGAKSVMVYDS